MVFRAASFEGHVLLRKSLGVFGEGCSGFGPAESCCGLCPALGKRGQPASFYNVTIISGRTSSKGVPMSYGSPAQCKRKGMAAWFSCCCPRVWRFPAWCRGGGTWTLPVHVHGHVVLLSPGSDVCLTWVSQVLSSCIWQDAALQQASAAGAGAGIAPVLQTHQARRSSQQAGHEPSRICSSCWNCQILVCSYLWVL